MGDNRPTLPLRTATDGWNDAVRIHAARFSGRINRILSAIVGCGSCKKWIDGCCDVLLRQIRGFIPSDEDIDPIVSALTDKRGLSYLTKIFRADCVSSIVISKPEFHLQLIGDILDEAGDEFYWADSVYAKCNKLLRNIFDYDSFRNGKVIKVPDRTSASFHWGVDSSLKRWDTAAFIQKTGLRYCPYCNAETVYVVPKSEWGEAGDYKSALDHFLPRSHYPFLGLSVYNLVPSCARCNTSYKLDRDPLSWWRHKANLHNGAEAKALRAAHPYVEDVYRRFEMRFALRDERIVLEYCPRTTDEAQRAQALMSCMFKWQTTYNTLFLSEARNLAINIAKMRPIYLEMIRRGFGDKVVPLDRLICGFDIERQDFLAQRLGKLKVDLFRRYANRT